MDSMAGDGYAAAKAPTPTSASGHAAGPAPTRELQNVTSELVDQARRGADAASAIGTSSSMAVSTLSDLIQKLKAEKIALNATISSAEDDSKALSSKLESSAQEIDGLRRELDSLRTRHRELQEQIMDDIAKAGGVDKEKEMLLRDIETCRRQVEQLHSTKGNLLMQVSEANARAATLEVTSAPVAHIKLSNAECRVCSMAFILRAGPGKFIE